MLATEYTYTIKNEANLARPQCTITVTRLADQATKVFTQAGNVRVEARTAHMESLTDECCGCFFPRPRKAKKDK